MLGEKKKAFWVNYQSRTASCFRRSDFLGNELIKISTILPSSLHRLQCKFIDSRSSVYRCRRINMKLSLLHVLHHLGSYYNQSGVRNLQNSYNDVALSRPRRYQPFPVYFNSTAVLLACSSTWSTEFILFSLSIARNNTSGDDFHNGVSRAAESKMVAMSKIEVPK